MNALIRDGKREAALERWVLWGKHKDYMYSSMCKGVQMHLGVYVCTGTYLDIYSFILFSLFRQSLPFTRNMQDVQAQYFYIALYDLHK